jgi:type IV pilus assembly protein PilN
VIEVNLLPAKGKGKGKKRGPKRSLPALSVPGFTGDRWVLGAGGLSVLALVVIGWLFFGVAGEAEELEVRIEAAQRDSARFADVIRRAETLQARRDSVAARVLVLQEIDGSRYVWPHVMDEVGRALPNFTWLTRVNQVSPLPNMMFRVRGRASTYFALTSFMENLEASPFMRGVRLITSDQVVIQVPGSGGRNIYEFELEVTWQEPPAGVVEREPLFGPSVALPVESAEEPGTPQAVGEDR